VPQFLGLRCTRFALLALPNNKPSDAVPLPERVRVRGNESPKRIPVGSCSAQELCGVVHVLFTFIAPADAQSGQEFWRVARARKLSPYDRARSRLKMSCEPQMQSA
jgi:hypothetical protein